MSKGIYPRLSITDRFWSKVNKTNTCWLWTSTKAHNGYGRFKIKGFIKSAHRVAYELIKGPIPIGLYIDHLCRIRHCVNPDHLEPVTPKENIHRSPLTFATRTHCPKGHNYDHVTKQGTRGCRICNNEKRRRYYKEKKLIKSNR